MNTDKTLGPASAELLLRLSAAEAWSFSAFILSQRFSDSDPLDFPCGEGATMAASNRLIEWQER